MNLVLVIYKQFIISSV